MHDLLCSSNLVYNQNESVPLCSSVQDRQTLLLFVLWFVQFMSCNSQSCCDYLSAPCMIRLALFILMSPFVLPPRKRYILYFPLPRFLQFIDCHSITLVVQPPLAHRMIWPAKVMSLEYLYCGPEKSKTCFSLFPDFYSTYMDCFFSFVTLTHDMTSTTSTSIEYPFVSRPREGKSLLPWALSRRHIVSPRFEGSAGAPHAQAFPLSASTPSARHSIGNYPIERTFGRELLCVQHFSASLERVFIIPCPHFDFRCRW